MDEEDYAEVAAIVDVAIAIHRPHPTADADLRKRMYRDGLRQIITHPELALGLIDPFPDNHPTLPAARRYEYIRKMYAFYDYWKINDDRLCALHGDFGVLNLFKQADGAFDIIDYSRIPWGEPGTDIGWLLGAFWHEYLISGNDYFKHMGEALLRTYEQRAQDPRIREGVCLTISLSAIIYATPLFWGEKDPAQVDVLFTSAENILNNRIFAW